MLDLYICLFINHSNEFFSIVKKDNIGRRLILSYCGFNAPDSLRLVLLYWKSLMSFRGFIAVALWFGIGFGVAPQLDAGSLVGTAWPIIWIAVLVMGIIAWNAIMKDD